MTKKVFFFYFFIEWNLFFLKQSNKRVSNSVYLDWASWSYTGEFDQSQVIEDCVCHAKLLGLYDVVSGKTIWSLSCGQWKFGRVFCCCLFVCFAFLDSVDEQIWISDIFLELWRTIGRVKILKGKIKIKNKK